MDQMPSTSPSLQEPSAFSIAQSHPGGRRGLGSSGVKTPLRFRPWHDLIVILILVVAPGIAALIALSWLAGVVSSFLALLMR